MSANHNGSLKRAVELVFAAKRAGADAIKLQTYTADTITINCRKEEFMVRGGLWDGWNLYELYKKAHTPWEWHKELFAAAEDAGITIFSTPFDATAVAFLEKLSAPCYKIASFELIDLPLIKLVAETGKPLIFSTGNASLAEIEEAVNAARGAGAEDITLLHCTSGYPTPASEANLATMSVLRQIFDCKVGLSDHTLGIGVSVAAAALGADVIEKHFTLDDRAKGADSDFSITEAELSALVIGCRQAAAALGKPNFTSTDSEKKTKAHRRSLYVVKEIAKGEIFTADHVRSIRPGYGIAPKFYEQVLGAKATCDLHFGDSLKFSDFQK